jgi:hypothetical protein
VTRLPSYRRSSIDERRVMDTYAIFRRNGWRTPEELQEAAERSSAEGARRPDELAWIRSYVLEERDRSLGMICIYEAASPEAIRAHAAAAALPVDEIVKVPDTVIVTADPVAATI